MALSKPEYQTRWGGVSKKLFEAARAELNERGGFIRQLEESRRLRKRNEVMSAIAIPISVVLTMAVVLVPRLILWLITGRWV